MDCKRLIYVRYLNSRCRQDCVSRSPGTLQGRAVVGERAILCHTCAKHCLNPIAGSLRMSTTTIRLPEDLKARSPRRPRRPAPPRTVSSWKPSPRRPNRPSGAPTSTPRPNDAGPNSWIPARAFPGRHAPLSDRTHPGQGHAAPRAAQVREIAWLSRRAPASVSEDLRRIISHLEQHEAGQIQERLGEIVSASDVLTDNPLDRTPDRRRPARAGDRAWRSRTRHCPLPVCDCAIPCSYWRSVYNARGAMHATNEERGQVHFPG